MNYSVSTTFRKESIDNEVTYFIYISKNNEIGITEKSFLENFKVNGDICTLEFSKEEFKKAKILSEILEECGIVIYKKFGIRLYLITNLIK